jgi:hypothetical protein
MHSITPTFLAIAALLSTRAAAILDGCDYGTPNGGKCNGKHSYCVSHHPIYLFCRPHTTIPTRYSVLQPALTQFGP